MLTKFKEWLTGTPTPEPVYGTPRSPSWPRVRRAILEQCPACRACGATTNLAVHHIRPYHIFPTLELDPGNLIVLCEGPMACHFHHGHLGSWQSYNLEVARDAARLLHKVETRP